MGRLVRRYIRAYQLDIGIGGLSFKYSDSVYWDVAVASDGGITFTGVGGTDDDFEIATVSGDIILDAAGKIMLEPTIEASAQYGVGIIPSDPVMGEYETCLRIDASIESVVETRHGAGIKLTLERPDTAPITSWGGSPDTAMMIDLDERADNTDGVGAARGLQIDLDNYGNINWIKGLDIGVTTRTTGEVDEIWGAQIVCESYGTIDNLLVGLDIVLLDESTKPTEEYGIRIRNTNNSVLQYADAAIKLVRSGSGTFNTGFLYFMDATGTNQPIAATGGIWNVKDDAVIADANGSVGAAAGFVVIAIDGTQYKLRTYAM